MTLVFLIKSKVKFNNARVLQGQLPERNQGLARQEDLDDQTDPSSHPLALDQLIPRCGVK